jgi:hypothetical protein
MKKLDQLLGKGLPANQEAVASAPTRAGADHVDAINRVFAEFELAYHNQFHKAYAQADSLKLAKKYWLNCLQEFTPEVIVRAARQLVLSQEYLPTVAALATACENAYPLFGLPPVQAAYVEACCAPEPKAQQHWSHPAVYLAGRQTSWHALATEPQAVVFPLFEYNYLQLCRRVLHGESLQLEIAPALPESLPQPLSAAENRARMQALRKQLDI